MSEDDKKQRFCIKSYAEELKMRIWGYAHLFKLTIDNFAVH